MNNSTLIGSDGFMGKTPIKTFNEAFEIRTRKFLSSHIEGENRVDGNLAFVVKDYEQLLFGLLEFIEHEKSLSNKR